MKKDNKDLYNKIMEEVSKQVKQSINEFDEISPKKQEITGEVYLVRCDGLNKTVLDDLTAAKEIPPFDNYGSGSIRIICKTPQMVVNTISRLVINAKALDINNSLGQAPRISIQKVNRNSVNDSINEEKRQNITKQYIQPDKIKFPRQKAKLEVILKINRGEMERTPEAIRAFLDGTGLWADRSEGQTQMDVNLIMKKTAPIAEISGDFITDYIYSPYNYDAGEFASPFDAAKHHVKTLVKAGLDVSIKEYRYSFVYFIHYNNKAQYDTLVKWYAWNIGYTDRPYNPVAGEDKKEVEEIIASGKKLKYNYRELNKD